MDPDNEILDALRTVIAEKYGRYLGDGISPKEAAAIVDALNARGVVLVLGDVPEVPELVAPVLEAGPLVTVNVNVTTSADNLAEVLDLVKDRGLAG